MIGHHCHTFSHIKSFSSFVWIQKSLDEHERHQGTFESIEKLRNFLCDRKYDISCDADLSCTFDYIKHIKWHFDIEE